MTQRRKGMLVLLVVLVVLPASGIGLIGVVETALWLVLLASWLVVFLTWAGKEPASPDTARG